MMKYSVKKLGIVTNIWFSDTGDETYYQPSFGKPERWTLHKDEFGAEPYDDADVLEEELRPDPLLIDISKKWVKLKAEYTVEIEDITAQYELEQCIAKRRAEYPSAEQFLNAFFDGGDTAIEELKQLRLAVKAKYPKP